jgi:dihydropteroate synthase
MKSIPLSVKAAEPSPAPKLSFLFHRSQTFLMGVLNRTPDSFYAGSRAIHEETALQLAEQMIDQGVDVLDVGGESTRPGAAAVTAALECERVLPIIEALHTRWPDLPISIDTQKAEVARAALARGAAMINDISALRSDPAMAELVAEAACPVVLMHMQGMPQTMQAHPHYENVVEDVKNFFEERLSFASRHNISEDRILLDPGIGFGKTMEHNLILLKSLKELVSFGRPLLVGISRKSFIGRVLAPSPDRLWRSPSPLSRERVFSPSPYLREKWLGDEGILPPEERLEGSLAAALWAVQEGARGLRVHDVGATRRALTMWEGIQSA